VESAALGGLAGIQVAFAQRGRVAPRPDPETAHGALLDFLASAEPHRFSPMNVNFGLFPPLTGPARGSRADRHERLAQRALAATSRYAALAQLEAV
jgi:methylenetetrahydrofolate--tRNA-(uracil-5-)-methyltransferase